MAQFLIAYFGGDHPSSPEEGKQHFVKYQQWLASLGEAAVSPMNPLKETATIAPSGSTSNGSAAAMSGFTIVEAGTLQDAVGMAKACPFLDIGGTLEVSEMVKMPGST